MVKQGYKQTEIGVIPEDWEVKKFEHFADKKVKWSITGGPFGSDLKKSDYTTDGIQIIQLQNIGDGIFINNDKVFSSVEKANQLLSSNIYPGEIIISKMGDPVARACFIPPTESGRYIMASDGIRLVVDENSFNKKFVHDYINSTFFRNRAFEVSLGSTRLRIGLPILKNLSVICPPLPEQKAIAQVLSDTDKLIQSIEQLIAKKKAIKQGAMQELLTGKKRLDGFTEPWVEKTIRDIGAVRMCKRIFSFQTDDAGDIPFYKIGTFGRDADSFISTKLYKEFRYKYPYPKNNDILISASGTIGRTVVYKGELAYYQDSNIVWIENDESLVLNRFLYYIYKSIKFNTEGSTIKRLYNNLLLSIPFSCPSLQEQQAIAEILTDMDREIDVLEEQLDKTKAIKQGMMQELLTGKTRLVESVSDKTEPLEVKDSDVNNKKEVKSKKHNEHFNDAVLIGTMASVFGSERFPLTRFMYTKVSYLLKRYKEEQDAGYLKKAAGPYKPKTRYGGAEKIALGKNYIKSHTSHYNGKKYEAFLKGDNVKEAIDYFNKWYGASALEWIEQFKYTKRNELELWATVDMAVEDLKRDNKPVSHKTVKELINNNKEWRPKLKRAVFSDDNINAAIEKLKNLFA